MGLSCLVGVTWAILDAMDLRATTHPCQRLSLFDVTNKATHGPVRAEVAELL